MFWKKCIRTSAISLIIVFFIFAYIFTLDAGYYLQSPSGNLVNKTDLLVLLGGGSGFREKTGVVVLKSGMASRVLLTGVFFTNVRGETQAPNSPEYDYLLQSGINKDSIILDESAKNTWEEILLVRKVLLSIQGNSVIIVTDPPHIRRVSWVCQKILGSVDIDFFLLPTRPAWWNADNWLMNQTSRRFVFKEYLKLAYYKLRYIPVP